MGWASASDSTRAHAGLLLAKNHHHAMMANLVFGSETSDTLESKGQDRNEQTRFTPNCISPAISSSDFCTKLGACEGRPQPVHLPQPRDTVRTRAHRFVRQKPRCGFFTGQAGPRPTPAALPFSQMLPCSVLSLPPPAAVVATAAGFCSLGKEDKWPHAPGLLPPELGIQFCLLPDDLVRPASSSQYALVIPGAVFPVRTRSCVSDQ